ncbi:hypothetical protein FOA43_000524 [Brettanomyces nanus]|uniref:Uncharacterized protein n=1 Tax=Eeniella nana TaxID=13502 RepID=A0A875RT73_EENNA|nr:uncharacterized protein FOA43_000524 [Brettanomyces nanus]QPG73217.1 hypothetical protein FOA43_000524 [Brettanomyces nanus]
MSRLELPGFYYDETRHRYFRIIQGGGDSGVSQHHYTSSTIQQKNREQELVKKSEIQMNVQLPIEILAEQYFDHIVESGITDMELHYKYLMFSKELPPTEDRARPNSDIYYFGRHFSQRVKIQSLGNSQREEFLHIPERSSVVGFVKANCKWYIFCDNYKSVASVSNLSDLSDPQATPYYEYNADSNLGFAGPLPTNAITSLSHPMNAFVGRINPLVATTRNGQVFSSRLLWTRNNWTLITQDDAVSSHPISFVPLHSFLICVKNKHFIFHVVQKGPRYRILSHCGDSMTAVKSFSHEPTSIEQLGDRHLVIGFSNGDVTLFELNKALRDSSIKLKQTQIPDHLHIGASVCHMVAIYLSKEQIYLIVSGLNNVLVCLNVFITDGKILLFEKAFDYFEYFNAYNTGPNIKTFDEGQPFFVVQSYENDEVNLKLYYLFYQRPLDWGPHNEGFNLGPTTDNPAYYRYIVDCYHLIVLNCRHKLLTSYCISEADSTDI